MSFMEISAHQGAVEYRVAIDKKPSWRQLAAAIDPELAQCFIVSVRCGCFMQAARSLNFKATRLRRQLVQLETQLQCSLFNHSDNGLSLSRDGLRLHAQLIALAHERNLPVIEQPLIRLAVA